MDITMNSAHPTVRAFRERRIAEKKQRRLLDSSLVKEIAAKTGAVDCGLIEIERKVVQAYREDIGEILASTKSIAVLAFPVGPAHLKSLDHGVVDHEFKNAFDGINGCARSFAQGVEELGATAINLAAGFPFAMERWPERGWASCEKLFAVEAGLGQLGINRLLLHPRYGSAVVLASVLLAARCNSYDQPSPFNPCIDCGLCVRVCPVGAVKTRGGFDFSACYTHNYREKLSGFLNWIEQITASRSAAEYRKKMGDTETLSMWQHLSILPQTKCDRCMAICPAGENRIGEYLNPEKENYKPILDRFSAKKETIYVIKGSDAERHVQKRFPAKTVKQVSNGLRPRTAAGFLRSLPLVFQKNRAKGLDAVYHFSFTGEESLKATVIIRNDAIRVVQGHKEFADLRITADSRAWVFFLRKDLHLLKALATGKIRLWGKPLYLPRFAACFPS